MNEFSVWEILMLLCFACSWPISIIKSLRTKVVLGKSPLFMIIIMTGYICGTIHKFLYNYDVVTYLYMFNFLLVSFDLGLYFFYIRRNKADLIHNQNLNK